MGADRVHENALTAPAHSIPPNEDGKPEMELEQRLKAAYASFKARSSETDIARFRTLIKTIHESAWDAIEGKTGTPRGPEFAHALSILEPDLSDRGKLPTEVEELTTEVKPDGSLLGTGKWELLDPGWVEALVGWLEHLDNRAPFSTSPVHKTIPNDVSLCLAGDWGTGEWRTTPISPSQAVGTQMTALKSDITLHLGDVYYAGTAEQEKANLIDIWPAGSMGSYTLNSNHEMYDGAFSYFDALKTHFTDQGGTSYFALENDDWLVVGLDSAYFSDPWELYMKGDIGADQIAWLKGLPAKQGIILSSHHTGFDLPGAETMALYDQVMDALADGNGQSRYRNVYWYWGHAHNAVVYQDRQTKGATVKARCIGHAAIPYGNASELDGQPQVAWYETRSANDPDIPVRVLAGFASIQLNGTKLTESLIGEDGSVQWSPG